MSQDSPQPENTGIPVAQEYELETPSDYARAALNRAQAAARAKGLYPGKTAPQRFTEPQVSGARSDGRDPKPLSVTLGSLLVQRGWNKDVAVGGVIGRWPEIVGEDISSHCTAESFSNSVLTIRAHSTAWATQLRFLTPNIMKALADEVGDGVVQEIKILGPDTPKFSRGKFSVKGRGARDTWG